MNEDLINKLKLIWPSQENKEEVMKEIFSKGLNITDAISIIRSLYKIKLSDAKEMVASSEIWGSIHEQNACIQEDFEKAALLPSNGAIKLHLIKPYYSSGMWVFDDPANDLSKEPFVDDANLIIDRLSCGIENAKNGFSLFFSDNPFQAYDLKLNWLRFDGTGSWYFSEKYNIEGWLCSALLKYFIEAPKAIYLKAEK